MALIAAAVMGGVAVSASVLAWGGSHSVAYAAETTSEDAVNLLADVFTNQTAGQFAQAPWYCVDTDGNSKEWPSGGTVRSAYAATSGTPEMLLLRWPGSYNNSVTVLEVPGLEANRKYTLTFTAANWNKNEERTVFVSFSTSKVLGASDAQSYSFTCRATSKALDKDRYDDTKEVRTFTFSTIAAGTYYIRFRCERDWADDTIIPISGFSLVDSGDASNAYLERYAEAKAEAEAFLALYPDASAESRQALQTLIDAAIPSTPEEADAAVEAFANTDIRRAIAETNARAAGVEGAVDFSSVIANPDATEGTGNEFPGWNLAQADGGAKMEVYREGKENPTLSDGTQLNYFNPANWGGSDWTTSMEQVVELPAGKYRLSALGRASDGLRWFRLVASTEVPADGAHLENVTETELPSFSFPLKGSTGELFGRGWNIGYCDFELPVAGKAVIAVQANTQKQYQWQSFTGFRIVRLEDYEVNDEDLAALEAAKNEAKEFLALYPQASAEAVAAIQTMIDAEIPTTKDEVKAATEAFGNLSLRRAVVETDARYAAGENVTDYSSVIVNPDATEGTGNEFPGWNLAQADGGAKMEVYREGKENPTLSDGTQLNYFNPANWGGSDWTTSMEQVVELPAGKYRLSALGRASDGLRWFRLVASTEVPADGAHLENVTETELPSYSFPLKGSTGELFGRGWNMGYCDFELPSDGKVVIAVQANTQKQYQWQSFTGFRLVRYADAEPVEAAPELPDLYVNGEIFTADAISLQMDEVEVTFDLPEDVQLFYKWETSDTGVSAFADAEEDSTDGFTEYTEPVKLSGNGFFHYYAQRGSLRSDVRSLAVSVMSAISAVEAAADASAEYYRLDGVRVDADALTPGIYVRRTAESAVKVVVK